MSPVIPQRYTEPSFMTQPLCESPQAIVLNYALVIPWSSFPLKYSTYLNIW